MNATMIKIAAAAVIAVAAVLGITQLTHHDAHQTAIAEPVAQQTLAGPMTHQLADGSRVRLAEGATIRTLAEASKRGFEHLGGQIDVTVAKGRGAFIVTTSYGDVKALGTQFTMSIMDDATAHTGTRVQLLAVTVKEGSVEVRNTRGITTLSANQGAVVALDAAPYDFGQDPKLPDRLRARVAAMLTALEVGDAAAWIANHNIDYMYKLIKGQERYDPQRFGGNEADLERIRRGSANIASPQDLVQQFLRRGAIKAAGKLYVRAVTLSQDGQHAQAECVQRESANSVVLTTPQWHFFDNDWWQVDD